MSPAQVPAPSKAGGSSNEKARIDWARSRERLFQDMMLPLFGHLRTMATLPKGVAPTRRLAILQVRTRTSAALRSLLPRRSPCLAEALVRQGRNQQAYELRCWGGRRAPLGRSLGSERRCTLPLSTTQVLLAKLIDIIDSAVPWETGPKFDAGEEPQYITRDFRCVVCLEAPPRMASSFGVGGKLAFQPETGC